MSIRKSQVLGGRAEQGGTGGGTGGEHKEKPGSHKDKPGSHMESNPQQRHSIRKNTMPIYGEISSIRGEPMSIRNQPCPRRDGGMEVDGDMEVGSIKIKTLSIKIIPSPFWLSHFRFLFGAAAPIHDDNMQKSSFGVWGKPQNWAQSGFRPF